MSNLVGKSFVGIGLDLHDLGISNSRPDGSYLDETLNNGIYSCVSGDGRLYFGITPLFPWEAARRGEDMPLDEESAKDMVANRLIDYLKAERSRIVASHKDYDELLEELPSFSDIIAKARYIDDTWVELQ